MKISINKIDKAPQRPFSVGDLIHHRDTNLISEVKKLCDYGIVNVTPLFYVNNNGSIRFVDQQELEWNECNCDLFRDEILISN